MITKSMIIEKDIWDLILTSPRPKYPNFILFLKEAKKDQMVMGIAWQIILKSINDQIAFNIMDLKDLKKMWEKLTNICSGIDQDMVYLIF